MEEARMPEFGHDDVRAVQPALTLDDLPAGRLRHTAPPPPQP